MEVVQSVKTPPALAGLWPPVATPFTAEGSVDHRRLVDHGRTLLAEGAHGLAILGTTSEANSLTIDERRRAIDASIEAGIPAARLMPGTGACAIDDAALLTRHAGKAGAAAALLLPPFYYKQVSDDGLFAFVAAVIERAGAEVPPIVLYHIPRMAGVGWSEALIGRLVAAFPGIVVGMKDSSGDFDNTRRMIAAFPGFAVFPGAEVHLVEAMAQGAAGCISASANINARRIREVLDRWREPGAGGLQTALNAVRKAVESVALIPAVKAVLAARYRDDAWLNVRPPLVPLGPAARRALLSDPAVASLLTPVSDEPHRNADKAGNLVAEARS